MCVRTSARELAALSTDREFYARRERNWLSLARSYELSEPVSRFRNEQEWRRRLRWTEAPSNSVEFGPPNGSSCYTNAFPSIEPRRNHGSAYLRQWAGADKRVCTMRKVQSGLWVDRLSPKGTSYKKDLYRIENVPP
jgi:hypothetical protein